MLERVEEGLTITESEAIRKRAGVEFIAIFAAITLSLIADDWRVERSESKERSAVWQLRGTERRGP